MVCQNILTRHARNMTHLDQKRRANREIGNLYLLPLELIRENGKAKEVGEKKVKVSKQKKRDRKREFVCVYGRVRELNSFTVLAFSSYVEQPC